MGYFATAEEVRGTLGAFLAQVMNDPVVGREFGAIAALIKVDVTQPDTTLWLDCRRLPPSVSWDCAEPAEVELTMAADDSQRFWLGRLSVPIALATRKVTVNGSITQLMKLVPVLKPVHRRYEQYLIELGRYDLLQV